MLASLFLQENLNSLSNDKCQVISMTEEKAIRLLKASVSPELFCHCESVAAMAAALANELHCNVNNARLAGWLHDCARELQPEELLRRAVSYGIEVDDISRCQPVLLHAPLGAAVAREWGIIDAEVLAAIEHHTLGKPGMTLLECIVYVADKIEPGRTYPGVDILREKVRMDFRTGLCEIAGQSIYFLLKKKQVIHPTTIAFWNWLLDYSGKEEGTSA
jgi:predicted HD superfamily hydrolase involved in NAD metabolism